MKYTFSIAQKAEIEIIDAAEYYESVTPDGAKKFIAAIDESINKLSKMPTRGRLVFPSENKNVRSIDVSREKTEILKAQKYPYKLIYKVSEDILHITIYQLWATRSGKEKRNFDG